MFDIFGYNHSTGDNVKMPDGNIISWDNYNFVARNVESGIWSFLKISLRDLQKLGLNPDDIVKHRVRILKDFSGRHVETIDILK